MKGRSLVISGAAPAYYLVQKVYPKFLERLDNSEREKHYPQVFYEVAEADEVVQHVLDGKCAMGITNRPLSDDELRAMRVAPNDAANSEVQTRWGKGVTVIVVNKRNPVQQMSIKQVEQAYRDHQGNWKQYKGGLNRPIDRIGSSYPLLSWNMFTWQVLGGNKVEFENRIKIDPHHPPKVHEIIEQSKKNRLRFPGSGPFPRYRDDAKVAYEVSQNPNAIGYCLLPSDGKLPDGVRALAIAAKEGNEAVPPTREHILLDELSFPRQGGRGRLVGVGVALTENSNPETNDGQEALHRTVQARRGQADDRAGLQPEQGQRGVGRVGEHAVDVEEDDGAA